MGFNSGFKGLNILVAEATSHCRWSRSVVRGRHRQQASVQIVDTDPEAHAAVCSMSIGSSRRLSVKSAKLQTHPI